MAHDITGTDHLFSVREASWHGLGSVLDHYPTREEAQTLGHPWEPVDEPIYRKMVTVADDGSIVENFEEVPSHVLRTRSDNHESLGVPPATLPIVKNEHLYDIAEAIQGEGADVMFETGGSLQGGRKVWLLLRLVDPIQVNGDPNGATLPFYALQNSHDGTGALRGQATFVRIVCKNTSQAADLDSKMHGTEFTFRHTKNIHDKIEEAKDALAGWRVSIQEWEQFNAQMLRLTFPKSDDRLVVGDFLNKFIPIPPGEVVSDRVRNNVEEARGKWREVYYGQTGEGLQGSAYGLIQASIEYAEHVRWSQSQETKFKRAVLDRNKVVQNAVTIARELVS